jgi:SAM-dependent methyltransferase
MDDHKRIDPSKASRLDDPARLEVLPPAVLWRALDLRDPQLVVEIGAGTGIFAAAFTLVDPRTVIYAADVEESMLEWMTQNRPEVAAGRIVPILSSETEVPVESGTADGVYMLNVHHELANPAGTYLEARRMLKPGGRVMVVDWAPVNTQKGPPMELRVRAEDLAAYLSAAGFADVRIHEGLMWHTMVTATSPGYLT